MCGIVAYSGHRAAAPILLEGLKRLEYRGYDSAGIAVVEPDHRIAIVKSEGKLSRLIETLNGSTPRGVLGVGHTRWATHGAPTTANAHPHTDPSGDIVVVHNGIIENYAALRAELAAQGHHFASETDTEVLAHLIAQEWNRQRGDYPAAVRRALRRVEGAYAIATFSRSAPDVLVGARHFSPLVVGVGDGEGFIASDIPALLPYTRRALLLEDGEVVTLRGGQPTITTLKGQPVERAPFAVTWDVAAAEKGGYPHFFVKEVYEQPDRLRDCLRGRLTGGRVSLPELDGLDLGRIDKVRLVACGTAYHAGLLGRALMESWARLPAEAAIGSEFRYANPLLDDRTLVVVVSQSGETADTLASLYLARDTGAQTLAVTNVVGSTITRYANASLYLRVGPEISVAASKSYLGQQTALALLALYLGQARDVLPTEQVAALADALACLPQQVAAALQGDEAVESVAARFAQARSFFYMGRGPNVPTALEGALKLKELSYIHAEGYPAGELKHGPIAMLDTSLPCLVVATQGATYVKTMSNIQEVRARGAQVIALATAGDAEAPCYADHVLTAPPTVEALSPIVNCVPLQLFAYHVAVARGCDVDQPRNLAKSVTVE